MQKAYNKLTGMFYSKQAAGCFEPCKLKATSLDVGQAAVVNATFDNLYLTEAYGDCGCKDCELERARLAKLH